MSTTHRSDGPLYPGYHHSGDRGLGVLASLIPGDGVQGPALPFPSLNMPGDAGAEVMVEILTIPSALTFFEIDELGVVSAEGPLGTHGGTFRLWVDGFDREASTWSVTFTDSGISLISGSVQLGGLGAGGGVVGSVPSGTVLAFVAIRDSGADVFRASAVVIAAASQHYATQADMVRRFGETEIVQLTDRSMSATAIVESVLESALEDADAEVNARQQARYRLPLATIPRLLVNVACDIARYRLHEDRAPEHVERRYDEALRTLDKIFKNQLSLGLDEVEAATPEQGGPDHFGDARTFSRGSLGDYWSGS